MGKDLYIKGLHRGGGSYHHFATADGSHAWSLPKEDQPGDWKVYGGGALKIHFNGIHLAKADYAVCWIHDENYLAEVEGHIEEDFEVVVAERARLVKKLDMHADQAATLAVTWAKSVANLLEVMNYPESFSAMPMKAIDHLEAWTKANPSSSLDEGVKFSLQKIQWQAGQYERDSSRSVGYRHNSIAAKESCKAVSRLQELRLGSNLTEKDSVHNLRIALSVANSAAKAVESGYRGFLSGQGLSETMPAIYQTFMDEQNTHPDSLFSNIRKKQSHDLCAMYGFLPTSS